MTTIYGRLGYDFEAPENIRDFSNNVIEHLNTAPSLVNTWQEEDIATSNVGGYFKNPVATVTTNLRNLANTYLNDPFGSDVFQGSTAEITSLFANTIADFQEISGNTGYDFYKHTDRISGAITIENSLLEDPDNRDKPHYITASATGRLMVYLVYKTDEVSNTSPVLGNFTSILIGDELNAYYNTISDYYATVNNSITVSSTTVGTPPNTVTIITHTSNLSLDVVTRFSTEVANLKNTLEVRRIHDENFYTNSANVLNDFTTVSQFNSMGEFQRSLIINYIGSDKLLERIL